MGFELVTFLLQNFVAPGRKERNILMQKQFLEFTFRI